MRPILIGAGRGSRLKHQTDEIPKSFVSVLGKPMIEHILDALKESGFSRKDIIFICGYKKEVIQAKYPEFTYVENTDWENNNILESLLYAREHLGNGFVSSYTDIVYWPSAMKNCVEAKWDKTLVCDTKWRVRYVGRSEHPESDAEKMTAKGDLVTDISRTIPSEEAAGEFIGVAKFSPSAGKELIAAYDDAKAHCETLGDRPFKKAYLIHLFQRMIQNGSEFHCSNTPGGYMELDTLQDLEFAEKWWGSWKE